MNESGISVMEWQIAMRESQMDDSDSYKEVILKGKSEGSVQCVGIMKHGWWLWRW